MPRVVAVACAALLAIATVGAQAATDDDDVEAVPYRPSVSAPAALSAPGWIEIEAGLAHQHTSPDANRLSLPYTVKLAFTPDWGVRIGGDAFVRQRGGGTHASGVGDMGFVVKRSFATSESSAFGLELGALFPSAKKSLESGSGKPDWGVNGIWSGDVAEWHADVNLAATRLGAKEPGASRTSWLYAVAVSHPLGERWGVVGEISGTAQRGVDDTRQLLLALSHNASKRLVLDVGAARGIRSGPPQWQAFAGLTWTAFKLF